MRKELEKIYTLDYWLHDPSALDFKPGLADYLDTWIQAIENYAEMRINIEDMFGVGDKVVTCGTFERMEVKTQEKITAIIINRFGKGNSPKNGK
jgi:hypothetical protein